MLAEEDKQKNLEYCCRNKKIHGQEIETQIMTQSIKHNYFSCLQWNLFPCVYLIPSGELKNMNI